MKKSLLISTLIVSSLLTASKYDYEITPVIGYNLTQGQVGLKNSPLVGIEAKYNKYDYDIKPELSFLYAKKVQSTTATNVFTDAVRIALDGVYEFKKNHRNRMFKMYPFVKAGLGYEYFSNGITRNDSNFFIDAGAGIKFSISPSLSFKTEAVYMLKNNHGFGDRNLVFLAGLSFAFGDGKSAYDQYSSEPRYVSARYKKNEPKYITNPRYAPIEPKYITNPRYTQVEPKYIVNPQFSAQTIQEAPVSMPTIRVQSLDDADNDGVKNSKDKCPNTMAGRKVNKKGCSKGDDDKDGVKNSKDKCPNTPFGLDVNKKGCSKDTNKDDDKDGVKNSKDKCANTPAGVKVNKKGCAKDGDKDRDGVLDSQDICPSTPMNAEVNEEGCELTRTINIAFKYRSTDIANDSLLELKRFSNFLEKNKQYHVTIVGHTDNVGSAAYNRNLSKDRATSVRDSLIKNGVLGSRLTARGDGEMYPLVTNTTEEGRAKNRRIEVVIEKVY